VTVREAHRLWRAVNRPNLMIKIPATRAGIPAIEQAIADGLNVNVTLIFALARYDAVMEAYLRGLDRRLTAGKRVDRIASVASFFVSRVDTAVDRPIDEKLRAGAGEATPLPRAGGHQHGGRDGAARGRRGGGVRPVLRRTARDGGGAARGGAGERTRRRRAGARRRPGRGSGPGDGHRAGRRATLAAGPHLVEGGRPQAPGGDCRPLRLARPGRADGGARRRAGGVRRRGAPRRLRARARLRHGRLVARPRGAPPGL